MENFENGGMDENQVIPLPEQVSSTVRGVNTPLASEPASTNGRRAKDAVAKSVVVMGIIVVLVIIGWLGITAVRTLPDGIGSFATAVQSIFVSDSNPEGVTSATSTEADLNDDTDTIDSTVPLTPGPTRTVVIDTTPVSNPNGTSDLAIRLIAIGTVDEDTGLFIQKIGDINVDDLGKDENVAVRFVVENLGDKAVEAWSFEAKLPTIPSKTFEAKEKNTGVLLPGTRTEFTLGFDRPRTGDREVRIEVDHDDKVSELSESNNTLVIQITLVDN